MYGKIFVQIFDSSLAENPDARHLFVDLVVLADKDGVVDMTVGALARKVNWPVEKVRDCIDYLMRPDPESRSPEHDGKRLIPLDEHRSWGWQLVNYASYRDMQDAEGRRAYFRETKRRQRAKRQRNVQDNQGPSKTVKESPEMSTHVDIKEKANSNTASIAEDIYINTLTRPPARSIYGDEDDSLTTSAAAARNFANENRSQAQEQPETASKGIGESHAATRDFQRNSRVEVNFTSKNAESAKKNRAELASNAPMAPSKGNPPSKSQTCQRDGKALESDPLEDSRALPDDEKTDKSADIEPETDVSPLVQEVIEAFPKRSSSALVFGCILETADKYARREKIRVDDALRFMAERSDAYAREVRSWPAGERGKCYSTQKFFNDEIFLQQPEFWRVTNAGRNREDERNDNRNAAVQSALQELGYRPGNRGVRAIDSGTAARRPDTQSDPRLRARVERGEAGTAHKGFRTR